MSTQDGKENRPGEETSQLALPFAKASEALETSPKELSEALLQAPNLSVEERQENLALTTEAIEARDDIAQLKAAADALSREAASLASPRERLELFLEAPMSELLVPLLPAEQVFLTIEEVGLSDALELLHLCSPEQFSNFVDLDAWRGDRFDAAKALEWIRAAGTDSDEDRFVLKYETLDVEVRGMIFRSCVKIWDLEEDDDPPVTGEVFAAPDGRFLLEFGSQPPVVDEETGEIWPPDRPAPGADDANLQENIRMGMRRIVESMYARDLMGASLFIESVRWELPSELLESAWHWRLVRLSEMGFPDMEEALSYYAYVSPRQALPRVRQPGLSAPGFALAVRPRSSRFLERCLSEVSDERRREVEGQIVTLLNAVLVAEKIQPADVDEVARALESARDTLALGLEHGSAGDVSRGKTMLEEYSIKQLFQLGSSLGIELRFRLDKVERRRIFTFALPGMSEPCLLLDEPFRSLFLAIHRRRPRFIDCRGSLASLPISDAPLSLRAFRTVADIEASRDAVAHIEQMADLFSAMGFDPEKLRETLGRLGMEKELPFVRLSSLCLTASAREAVGLGFSFEPLPAEKLKEFGDAALVRKPDGTPEVNPGFAELFAGRLRRLAVDFSPAHVSSARLFSERALKKMFSEMAEPWSLGILHLAESLPVLVVR